MDRDRNYHRNRGRGERRGHPREFHDNGRGRHYNDRRNNNRRQRYGERNPSDRPVRERYGNERYHREHQGGSRGYERLHRRDKSSERRPEPHKRNYEEELEIIEIREREAEQQKILKGKEEEKERKVYRGIHYYESDDDDNDDSVCTMRTYPGNPSVQASAVGSSRKRRYSASENTIARKLTEQFNERFKKPTENMVLYKESMINFSERPISQHEAFSLPVNMLMAFDYSPEPDNFYDKTLENGQIMEEAIACFPLHSKKEEKEVHSKIIVKQDIEDIEMVNEVVSKSRFFEISIDEEIRESQFRSVNWGTTEIIKISKYPDDWKPQWVIKEQKEAQESLQKELSQLRREAFMMKAPIDDQLLVALLQIQKNPKDKSGYYKYLSLVEKMFNKMADTGSTSEERDRLNEGKFDILEKAMAIFPEETKFSLERVKVLIELRKDHKEILRELRNLFLKYPTREEVVSGYLDYLQYDNMLYNSKELSEAFNDVRRNLERLVKDQRSVDENIQNLLVKVWLRELKWLAEQGRYPQVVASIQASIEISFFQPENIPPGYDSDSLFEQYWKSGQSRIGDRHYKGGFQSFNPLQLTPDSNKEEELQYEVKEEYKQFEEIRKTVTDNENLSNDWITVESMAEHVFSRPLRNLIEIFEVPQKDVFFLSIGYTHVAYESLAMLQLRQQDAREMFNCFGIEFDKGENFDWYKLSKELGCPQGAPLLCPGAYVILCRILLHIVQYSAVFPAHLLPFVFLSNVQYAAQMKMTNKEKIDFLSKNRKEIQDIVREKNDLQMYQEFEAMINFIFFEQFLSTLTDPIQVFANVLERLCTDLKKNRSVLKQRVALAYLLRFVEYMGPAIVSYNNGEIYRWLENISAVPNPQNTINGMVLCFDRVVEESSNFYFEPFMPSTKTSAASILILLVDNFSLADKIYQEFERNFQVNTAELMDVHYAKILHLKRTWNEKKWNRKKFVDAIRVHFDRYPYDFRVIKIGFEYMKKQNSTILICRPTLDGNNPFFGSSEELRVHYLHNNKNWEAIKMFLKLSLLEHKQYIDGEKHAWFAALLKEARDGKNPYLWSLVLSYNMEFYEEACKRIPYSKRLHTMKIKMNQDDEITLKTLKFLEDHVGLKICFFLKDILIMKNQKFGYPSIA